MAARHVCAPVSIPLSAPPKLSPIRFHSGAISSTTSLVRSSSLRHACTRITASAGTYARATDLADALALLGDGAGAVVVAGSTDWGVEVNLRGARAPFVIGIDRVPELRALDVGADRIEIGAALTLSEIETALDGRIPLIADLIPQFASRLIRNTATIGGNLATASPIGDAAPALLALEATVVLASEGAEREVPLAGYFTGYRETARRADEIIRAVRIPLPLSPIPEPV